MWILPLVGYAGVLLGFGFLTLAIASGLYYLSELVEEHTVFARKLLSRLIYTIIGAQILLAVVDRFPIWLSLLSIASHGVYMGNLRHFPIVKLSDPVFITSCGEEAPPRCKSGQLALLLVLTNHFLWFHHFSKPPTHTRASLYDPIANVPTFTEISAFFGIFVWLVPFSLFVSLSAGENVLPSMGSEYATGGEVRTGDLGAAGGKGRKQKGLVKAGVDWVVGWASETGEVMGLWKGERSRRF